MTMAVSRSSARSRRLRAFLPPLLVASWLAGCGGPRAPVSTADLATAPARSYAPPGPASDPWGPYIREAASRFDVRETWIRAVMRQESGGQSQAVSSAGAIGLMQLMPATYADLRDQLSLGNDPFNPHDNMLAGTAYLKQLYDQFGAPGFLAAYNAGPGRLSDYLATGNPLPVETVNYVAAIAPRLGEDTPMSGPLAAYAGGGAVYAAAAPTPRSLAAGCDPDAAYDPNRPCHSLERAAVAPAPPEPPPQMELAEATPPARVVLGSWGIQVGAFRSPDLARSMAGRAQAEAPELLGAADVSTPTTTPFGGAVLYRARLVALSEVRADLACQRLNARQLPCIVVRPERT